MKKHFRNLAVRLLKIVFGTHPYNTIFNYNWVNVSPMVRVFTELGKVMRGHIADLGAGRSPYYDLVSVNAKSYTAIDYFNTNDYLEFIKNDKRNIKRVAGNIEAIPLKTESMDVVFCSQVLEHVLSPKTVLNEISRILCSNGYAIISVPHISPIHLEPYDFYRFTPIGLSKLCETTGLQTLQTYVQGQFFASFALCFAMNLVLRSMVFGKPIYLPPKIRPQAKVEFEV